MARIIVRLIRWDPEVALDAIFQKGVDGLNKVVLPHVLEVAVGRAPSSGNAGVTGTVPVGADREPSGKSRKSSFEPLDLRKASEGRYTSEERDRLRDLHAFQAESARELANQIRSSDIKFFKGRKGTNKGATPAQINIINGFAKGVFTKRGGTLKGSHVIVPAKREGNRVVGQVQARAKYAAAVHEGFTHRGGFKSKDGGKTTQIKGRPWLAQALENARDDLLNPATYEG